MTLDDYTSSGLLRQWFIIDGQPRCPFNAGLAARLPSGGADAVLAANAAVRAAVAAVTAYEDALRLAQPDEPDETIQGMDEDGEPSTQPNPAYTAWWAAQDAIDAATPETIALAEERAGVVPLDDDGNPAPIERPEPTDAFAGLPEYVPVPLEISDRQFAQQLAVLGEITNAEAIAWAARGELPAALVAAVSQLPGPMQFPAEMLLSSATIYRRDHSLTPVLGMLFGFDSATLDQIWRDAAQL